MAILRRDCPHCPASQVAFELKWNEHPANQLNDPRLWTCVATCGACCRPISFVATNTQQRADPPSSFGGEIEPLWNVPQTWPSRIATSAPPFTPLPVANRFRQGENAFQRGDWNAAVAMYRSALDIATKGMEGVPEGLFFPRLKWLHEQHRITPDMRAWADHVRVEGNEALHDPDDFTEDDAKPLRLFTEMFLRYVFELPGEVRAFRGEPDPPPPA